MDALITLLSQFSIEGIIITLVMFLAAVKVVGELLNWCYEKIKQHFNWKTQEDNRHSELMENFNELKVRNKQNEEENLRRDKLIEKISNQLDEQDRKTADMVKTLTAQTNELTKLKDRVQTLTDRVQDSTKAYIIDKHHHFVYQVKAIDDMSLQELERRFVYYKAAGGNTFIDGLMEEVRDLPKVTVEQMRLNQTTNE